MEQGLELAGRYRLDAPIGAGGMGDVWRGVDLRLRRPVAIKILPTELAADQSAVERFRREAETTAGLQHPGITVTFDIDEHGPLIFLVMELLTGRDLGTVLAGAPGGMPIATAVSLVSQAADALAAAHSRGIVHRDIKPANLFLLDDGRVKLCDFGIARLGGATQLTAAGSFIGTPSYMAPEQFRSEPLDARSDLYSLGCVLYELLTGKPPFESPAGPAALMYQHLNAVPVPPRTHRPEIPAHLERLTLDLLAKDSGGRPPNAAAVITALQAPPGTTIDWTPAPQSPEKAPRRRRRLLFGLTAAALAIAVAGGTVLEWGPADGGPKPRPTPAPTSGPPSPPRPVVTGWTVNLVPQYGIAYDAPPGWKIHDPDYAAYFQDTHETVLAAEKGVSEADSGKCTRAVAGVRGGARPVLKPTPDQLGVLRSAAGDEARKWGAAAYGAADSPPREPKVTTGSSGTILINGITAARASVRVTPAAGGDACAPAHALVETIAMAASSASSLGPVFFTVFADRNVSGQATTDEIKKILGSVRPYTCPPGTALQKTQRCA
ncbi:serine/threonine-protein kinase [Actinomadura sp. DC4]|uniref:serine/threonine-protein kinase n=1 Tax=Actinomadura sp. DC4 TaxID=3055069 RepID=UPI0025B0FB5E|nr:serine/threonine-protein kinase [Actinomadura sp. DC4]MDN3352185.1 serine/threonine-protein kinase [Actinomadura sp. DC4]